jgi:hypothetical protein
MWTFDVGCHVQVQVLQKCIFNMEVHISYHFIEFTFFPPFGGCQQKP